MLKLKIMRSKEKSSKKINLFKKTIYITHFCFKGN